MRKYETPTAEVLSLQLEEEIATDIISIGGGTGNVPDPAEGSET